MIIGIPKEIKEHEYRIGATPAMVRAFAEEGHQILVEKNAGKRSVLQMKCTERPEQKFLILPKKFIKQR